MLKRICAAEQPVIFPDAKIVFTRTVKSIPATPLPEDIERKIHLSQGKLGFPAVNICADWGQSLECGLLGRKEAAVNAKRRFADNADVQDFLDAVIESLDAVMGLVERYAIAARQTGREDLAEMLKNVPGRKPNSFHEALQSLRFMQAAAWISGVAHVGFGRFDQYLWPYLKADFDAGRLTRGEAEDLLAEFFISLNQDSDIHLGVQTGDNGQSLMLGGVMRNGENAVNPLTWMTLRVSEQVNMIDPKLNLRVCSQTGSDLLFEAVNLTRRGLGFPQYSNDEVVIPGLIKHGYSPEDACDYTVAACWEFIIPGVGMDVPNINAMSFPYAADKAICEGLQAGDSFEGIMNRTKSAIREQVQLYVNDKRDMKYWPPNPYYSALMTHCLEKGRDINNGGAKYYNYGIHGSGSSNAADALTAVKELVFDKQEISGESILNALTNDFSGYEVLRHKLHDECSKIGNGLELPEKILRRLFGYFADVCEEIHDNGRGGIVRPGTGSAMYYIWLARGNEPGMLEPVVGATADGRRKGEYFSCSLAPSPGVTVNGPVSVMQDFSKIDYPRVCNGGPVTLELSDTVFSDEEARGKVADLIRIFVNIGCQQLQLNTVNPEILKDARVHPEAHRNLIVRVWGWSGYFCELASEYQEHIIARSAMAV